MYLAGMLRRRFAAQLARVTRAVEVRSPRAIKCGALLFGAALALNAAAPIP